MRKPIAPQTCGRLKRKGQRYNIHRDLLVHVDWSSADVAIRYCNPGIKLKTPENGMSEGNLAPHKGVAYQGDGWSQVGIESWRRLYVEKMISRDVLKYFYQNYPAIGKDGVTRMNKEADELKGIASWEEIESGLPEVF